jgi:hypothetical protein
MERADAAVLETIGGQVVDPDIVRDVVAGVWEAFTSKHDPAELAALDRELTSVSAECARLVQAIATGGDLPVLLDALRGRQARQRTLQTTIDRVQARQIVPPDRRRVEALVRARLKNWRALLTSHVQAGRNLLREILIAPIQFTPVQQRSRRGYAFRGEVSLQALLAGAVEIDSMTMASPTGFEPVFWP